MTLLHVQSKKAWEAITFSIETTERIVMIYFNGLG